MHGSQKNMRTSELMLYNRIDQGGQESPRWIDFVYQIMLEYNNQMVHSSIKMTPYADTKPRNAIDAKSNIDLQTTLTRTYPELEIGSSVNMYKQKRNSDQRDELLDLVNVFFNK